MEKKKSTSSKLAPNLLLGQHFLRSQNVIAAVVETASIATSDVVLEIGPGKGTLTEALVQKAGRVIAVEKDPRMVQFLEEKFREHKNIKIIEGDILALDRTKIFPKKYKIVANLPYYLTSRFLRIFLETQPRPESMTLMVQYELARRIVARPPEMNLLALSVQAYGTPRVVQKVNRSQFKPQPNVDSAIISITNISDSFFKKNDLSSERFFEAAKKAFQQKRKMLKNTLGTPSTKRPQELSLDDWKEVLKDRA